MLKLYLPKVLITLAMMAMMNLVSAQRTISGVVSDAESGDPLLGASILVKGTTSGTVTDFDGAYTFDVPEGGTTLIFSYTGYGSQEVEIGDQTTINLTLSAGTELEQIVVTGYGTQKAKEVTGSIAHVGAEDFNGGNINQATLLLQGKVGGACNSASRCKS